MTYLEKILITILRVKHFRCECCAMSELYEPFQTKLPLVSVIIANYNYQAFLHDAVKSIFNQTYPNIECIVVDDCSTDDSVRIILELEAEFAGLRYHRNERNGGQSISCYNGFVRTRGAYVIFLDADDYLFPTCVETHVRAHLSLRLPVGLTSVDMTQIVDDNVTVATSQGFSEFVRSKKGRIKDLYRSYSTGLTALSDVDEAAFADKLHYVHPSHVHWPWSPTSGNCFRRDALDLILHNENLSALRSCTDIYLLRGVAALTGSVLIDEPLAGYRLHGGNCFIITATINQVRVFDRSYLKTRSDIALTLIIDHIFANASSLIPKLEQPSFFTVALDTLGRAWPPIGDETRWVSYLTRKLILNRDMLVEAFGKAQYNEWLVRNIFHGNGRQRQPHLGQAVVGALLGLVLWPFIHVILRYGGDAGERDLSRERKHR